jgi:hypothetical protein
VEALATAQPECYTCGRPLNVIVQKKGLTFWYINVSWDEKLICPFFINLIYIYSAYQSNILFI